MALTQKMLKAMGIEDDQREQILDAHQEVLESIKSERDEFKKLAEQVPDLQRQLEEAKAASGDSEWEQKYEDEHQAFEDFKSQVATEKAEADKAQAYRGVLMAAGIDPKRIDTIMRVTDLSQVEMEDGKLKDTEKLQESAKQEWADFVVKSNTQGSNPATPPTKSSPNVEGGDPEVARRMQERYERRYGKAQESKE